jgi:class 3 adenylate cyclase/tetratricopeptide (TPR) repeat protein
MRRGSGGDALGCALGRSDGRGRATLRCSRCGHENPPDSRFCEECGAGIQATCLRCEAPLSASAKFCSRCGASRDSGARAPAPERSPRDYTPRHLAERILTSRSALEGERKQVTVLFADVTSSMEISEHLDPETWHGIMDRFFAILTDGVHRFEGTVNQYTGDGIMALFGAPIAHEDHAQRACYATLELRDRIARYGREVKREHGLGFAARMGLHSGEVVVGKIGDDLRMDYTAQGHTTGLAARMQELASPDTIYLSADLAGRVSGYFELEDLGAFAVKGVAGKTGVFQLRGLGPQRTRFDVSRSRGLSRFVGRADEMRVLETALTRAREGRGQAAGVVAEAGAGKSRLCFEFLERCRGRGLTVLEGHAVAHGRNIPFLPILQIVRAYFGVGEGDDDRVAREKIAGRLLLLDEQYRESLPLIFEFAGVADPEHPAPRMDPEAKQRRLFGLLRRLLEGPVTQGPTLTLIEDLQWLDGGSEAWLAYWVEVIAGTPNLLLVNFRPEYHADWMHKSWYQQLPLLPLGPEAVRELLDDLLGGDASLEGLAEAIHRRTGGNPFFTEEVVRTLVESGQLEGARGSYRLVHPVERLEVPDTVTSLLAARIDRLAEREKRVLQSAAVIGKRFSEPILQAVAELPAPELAEALAGLKGAEFVYEESLYPVAEYAFKHPLTQEVALHSQLRERRRRVHAGVARAIEAAYGDRLDEASGLLAHHWEEASEPLPAARWHRRAAEWAGLSDPAQAYRHWQRVLALVRELPESRRESTEMARLGAVAGAQVLNLAWRMGLGGDESEAVFRDGVAMAEHSGDRRLQALIRAACAIRLGLNEGDLDRYLRFGREASRLAEQTDDLPLQLEIRSIVMYATGFSGQLAESLAMADDLIAAYERDPASERGALLANPRHTALFWRAYLLTTMGRLDESERETQRAVTLARQRSDDELLVWSLSVAQELAALRGEVERVLDCARQAVAAAERCGSQGLVSYAYDFLGRAHCYREEWEAAIPALERAGAIARETGTNIIMAPAGRSHLAAAYLAVGDRDRALAVAREAVASPGSAMNRITAAIGLARVLLAGDGERDRDEAREILDGALDAIAASGYALEEPHARVERARWAEQAGDAPGRERELREAHRLWTKMGATAHAERVARALAR